MQLFLVICHLWTHQPPWPWWMWEVEYEIVPPLLLVERITDVVETVDTPAGVKDVIHSHFTVLILITGGWKQDLKKNNHWEFLIKVIFVGGGHTALMLRIYLNFPTTLRYSDSLIRWGPCSRRWKVWRGSSSRRWCIRRWSGSRRWGIRRWSSCRRRSHVVTRRWRSWWWSSLIGG